MSIFPLPVFEADADPAQRDGLTEEEAYARLESPKTLVVRFGSLRLIGEFPFSSDAKPGCGSKLVARTHRGTELVEMLTTTCSNAGCGKSVTRQEMLEYIRASGGSEYPFHRQGRVFRVATIDDLNAQSEAEARKPEYLKRCRQLATELELDMKVVDVEPILGGELLTFYYMSEDRVDFRELVKELAASFSTRIEMRQVGARDEARLVADYERCGQYCCCKGFLKVLKPVSMRSAKVQKATLDPLKISGRCGRLMCCLRYEDQTYAELKKNLPHRKTRVGTPEGPGLVLDSKILVQLVLVKLEHDNREIAVPVEDLCDPEQCPPPGSVTADPLRGMPADAVEERIGTPKPKAKAKKERRRGRGKGRGGDAVSEGVDGSTGERSTPAAEPASDRAGEPGEGSRKKRRRRRRRRGGGQPGDESGAEGGTQGPPSDRSSDRAAGPAPDGARGAARSADDGSGAGPAKRKRRRRRRRGGRGSDDSRSSESD